MLTLEEKVLLTYLAKGFPDREIAKQLPLNRHGRQPGADTANRKVRDMLHKIGARTRLEAVAIALVNEWVHLPDYKYK